MSQSQFLEVLAQICDGLAYAHRNGVIHRDIKPANVRVIRDGKRILAKVMDFGIARTQDSNMTATGIVMGTVSYMAPEYIQSGRTSALGDLWAVGVMLYECLACRKPFGGDNTTTILFKIVSETPAPLDSEDIQGISPSVRSILDKALAKDPVQRFQTAEELAKALRACKDPSWQGTLDATAMIARHQAVAQMAGMAPQGTVQLPSSASMAMPVAPTMAMPAQVPPTAMMPAQPDYGAPTAMMPMPGQAPLPPTAMMPMPGYGQTGMVPVVQPEKKGSRTMLFALGGVGLLALGGAGTYWALSHRAASTALSPSAPPSVVTPASPAPAPVVAAAPVPAPQPAAAPAPLPASTSKPAADTSSPKAVKPLPVAAPVPAAPAPAPKPEPAKVAEETSGEKLAKASALIGSDPALAASQLRSLASSRPSDPAVQGAYLAALARSRNFGEFNRALGTARGHGQNVKVLMGASAPFRSTVQEERRNPGKVYPKESFEKILEDFR